MSKYLQNATYWEPAGLDAYSQVVYGSPVAILVRWEEKTEMFLDSSTGKEIISNSIVYTKSTLIKDGFIFLGKSDISDPQKLTSSFTIRRVDNMPSVKGNKFTRKVWL